MKLLLLLIVPLVVAQSGGGGGGSSSSSSSSGGGSHYYGNSGNGTCGLACIIICSVAGGLWLMGICCLAFCCWRDNSDRCHGVFCGCFRQHCCCMDKSYENTLEEIEGEIKEEYPERNTSLNSIPIKTVWTGFYKERYYQHPMRMNMNYNPKNGKINCYSGDNVGKFHITGSISEDGIITFKKQYLGPCYHTHFCHYIGALLIPETEDGKQEIKGRWYLNSGCFGRGYRGDFELSFRLKRKNPHEIV